MLIFIDLTHAHLTRNLNDSHEPKKNIKHMDNKLFIIVMHEYNFFMLLLLLIVL